MWRALDGHDPALSLQSQWLEDIEGLPQHTYPGSGDNDRRVWSRRATVFAEQLLNNQNIGWSRTARGTFSSEQKFGLTLGGQKLVLSDTFNGIWLREHIQVDTTGAPDAIRKPLYVVVVRGCLTKTGGCGVA